MDFRLRKRLAVAAVLLASGLAFGLRVRNRMVDFTVNYTAGERIRGGETLYRAEDGHYQFKYSPYCAMIYLPLSCLPLSAAKGLWFALVLGATAAMIILTRRLLGPSPPPASWTASVLPPFILAKYIVREIDLGQINAVVTAVLLAMAVLLAEDEAARNPGKSAAAGFLWGTAVSMKPYAVIFLPYFFYKRKWNALWPGLFILAASFLIPAVFYGFPGNLAVHLEWIESLSKSTAALLTSQDNVSLLAFFMKWTRNVDLARLAYGGTVIVLSLAVLVFIRRGRGRPGTLPAESGLLLLAIPLVSPLGWDYTFLASLPAVALVVSRFRDFPVPVRAVLGLNFAVIGLSLYDFLGRGPYAAFMNASVLTLDFLLVGAALFHLRMARKI
ncbi:MAG: DUF2029 domain-containing protein [Candidatus Aminicenantes bacterium]|nr:DUF2029 domain-containing protein [Candidatus Aminicenantes bacterium]